MHSCYLAITIALAATHLVPCAAIALTPSNASLENRATPGTVYMDCKDPNTVALTFDDGPASYHTEVSNTLSNAGIKGTFFVNGQNYDCIYDQPQVDSIRASFAAGHQFASHTWSHPDLKTLGADAIREELTRINTALQKILGVVPTVMRPPYGSYDDEVEQVAAEVGQSLVLWNFDSEDANGATPEASKQAYTELVNRGPSSTGTISLEHETIQTTADDVLPFAIDTFKAKGYKFVTISECIGIPAYQSTQEPGQRDSSWTC